MNSKTRIIPVFFILILNLFPAFPFVESAGYGEENENLGQFTDDFENDDNVSVAVDVINNQTLDCMELNYTLGDAVTDDKYQLREHKTYAQNPVFVFSIDSNEYLYVTSNTAGRGRGWTFLSIKADIFNGSYVRWRWGGYTSTGVTNILGYWVVDGQYDRTSNVDFPTGATILSKGIGTIDTYYESFSGTLSQKIVERQLFISGGSEDYYTIFFFLIDAWTGSNTHMKLDWIEINANSGGSNNIWSIDFNDVVDVNMEVTGTTGDYGYINNAGLPIVSGGYEEEGYFITEDYLNYTTGQGLALLANASIPVGTSITVQFSNDGATWVDNEGNVGSTPVLDGFYAIDLRDLNYTDSFKMYNLSTTNSLITPRLFQSREITTNGTAGTGTTVTVESFFWIPIAIVLSIIAGLLVWLQYEHN